ncbi:hypothetical protein IBX35_01730 [Candidatus Bathyarchaeota archaeon]|nr:hypothetical protein [Candidatus Bathyarchaeota archaeon]
MVEEGGLRGCVVRSFLLGTWRHFGINLVCNGKAKSVILLVPYLSVRALQVSALVSAEKLHG